MPRIRSLRTCPVVEDLFRILIVALARPTKGMHLYIVVNGKTARRRIAQRLTYSPILAKRERLRRAYAGFTRSEVRFVRWVFVGTARQKLQWSTTLPRNSSTRA